MKRNDMPAPEPPQTGRRRLDKWLWAARFYKTRSLAAQAVEKGHVKVRGERVKPAHPLRPGEQVSLRRHGLTWSVDVLVYSDRRGSAAHAAEQAQEARQRQRPVHELSGGPSHAA